MPGRDRRSSVSQHVKTLQDFYAEFDHDLAEAGIRNLADYDEHRGSDYLQELELRLLDRIAGSYPQVARAVFDDRSGANLLFLDGRGDSLSRVAHNKALVYGNHSILLTGEARAGIELIREHRSDTPPELDEDEIVDAYSLVRCILQYSGSVRLGAFVPVPTSVDTRGHPAVRHRARLNMTARGLETVGADGVSGSVVAERHGNTLVIRDSATLEHHLRLGILAPGFDGLVPSAIQQLREDYREEFCKFQDALVGFLSELEVRSGDERLRAAIFHVDEQARRLEREAEKLKAKHASLGVYTGLVTFIAVVVLKNTDADYAKLIQGLFAASALALIRPIADGDLSKKSIDGDPFRFVTRIKAPGPGG